jgi:2-oxoglutarate dehydrogenase E2 component (dihydrolipoamide succinyltransferase)
MGDSITEGTLQSWAKKVGETVAVDEVVAVIETDKVTTQRGPHRGTGIDRAGAHMALD